jgi:hypothetical protein
MDADRWLLTVTFDSIAETQAAGAYEGGLGEAADFYRHIREYWDNGDPDFTDEVTSLDDETVTATCQILAPFSEPLSWLLMRTVPKSVSLERCDPRGMV